VTIAIKLHLFDEIDFLGEDTSRILPGDRCGWFFNINVHGLVISTNENNRTALVLWSGPQNEITYIIGALDELVTRQLVGFRRTK